MLENKLITVRVISYNAEKTILDTLESVKNQTYQNIELVVSDDCSTDNTVIITRDWLEKNKYRFVRTELITVDKNTGVCANLNRAIKAARGEYIKGIAADDILLPNCIEDFVKFANEHPEAHFIASLMKVYNETFEDRNYINTIGYISKKLLSSDVQTQLRSVAFKHSIGAPSVMYSKALFDDLGGYDDRYGYEDHPFYVSMLERGYKIFFLSKETVGYRVHGSTMHAVGKLFNPNFLPLSKRFRKERCFQYYTWRQRLSLRLMWAYQDLLETLHLNKATRLNSIIYRKVHAFTLFIAR